MNTTVPIDWSAPLCHVTTNFTVHDCLWLPQWNRLASVEMKELTEDIKDNLRLTCTKMEMVRTYLNAPIIVHCMLRPPKYNVLIGGSQTSKHPFGEAADFHVKGYEGIEGCNKIRTLLIPQLESFGLRMEDHVGNWVHLDTFCVPGRPLYFKP